MLLTSIIFFKVCVSEPISKLRGERGCQDMAKSEVRSLTL
jgi:hypothetical protein